MYVFLEIFTIKIDTDKLKFLCFLSFTCKEHRKLFFIFYV